MNRYGTLDKSYHFNRITKRALRYRLNRRTMEVISSIKKYYDGTPKDIIDLGAADGLMLSILKDKFPAAKCVGIEYSRDLIEANKDERIILLQGDVNFLEMPENSFDIAIATAIIEHVPDPTKMIEEAKRVLRPGGIIVLTSPDPFWEKVATMIGHLPKEQHFKVPNLREIGVFLIALVLRLF